MGSMILSLLCFLAMMSSYALAADMDPAALLGQARQLEGKKHDYKRAFTLLEKANAIWETQDTTSPAYAESLTLAAILLVRKSDEDRNVLSVAAERVARAISIYREHQPTGPDDLALALEVQAIILGGKNLKDTAGWTEAAGIRAKRLSEEIVTPVGLDTPAIHPNGHDMDVRPAKLITKIEPEYSVEARILRVSGLVKISVIIEADGKPSSDTLKEGLGFGLDEEAAKAVRQWRFEPATKSGAPVRSYATIELKFRIV